VEEDRATKTFEAHLSTLMQTHGIDRDTAIRWDLDAMGLSKDDLDFYGLGFYAYQHGLKTNYFDKTAA